MKSMISMHLSMAKQPRTISCQRAIPLLTTAFPRRRSLLMRPHVCLTPLGCRFQVYLTVEMTSTLMLAMNLDSECPPLKTLREEMSSLTSTCLRTYWVMAPPQHQLTSHQHPALLLSPSGELLKLQELHLDLLQLQELLLEPQLIQVLTRSLMKMLTSTITMMTRITMTSTVTMMMNLMVLTSSSCRMSIINLLMISNTGDVTLTKSICFPPMRLVTLLMMSKST